MDGFLQSFASVPDGRRIIEHSGTIGALWLIQLKSPAGRKERADRSAGQYDPLAFSKNEREAGGSRQAAPDIGERFGRKFAECLSVSFGELAHMDEAVGQCGGPDGERGRACAKLSSDQPKPPKPDIALG